MSVCHNVDTDEKKIGPSLKGLFKRGKLKNGKPVTDDNVKHDQHRRQRYARLRGYAVGSERADVIAYLKTV